MQMIHCGLDSSKHNSSEMDRRCSEKSKLLERQEVLACLGCYADAGTAGIDRRRIAAVVEHSSHRRYKWSALYRIA